MAQTEKLQINLNRKPAEGVPASSPEGARRWILGHVETQLVHGGRVPPRLMYLGDGWIETVDLQQLDPLGREEAIARLFVALGAQRPGVLRRFRVGEVLLRDEGRLRRAAAILEHVPDPTGPEGDGNEGALTGTWWAAHRFVGQEADGFGALHGTEWTLVEGRELAPLPEPLREWLEVGDAEFQQLRQSEMKRSEDSPDVRAAVAELRIPLPAEPSKIAGLVGSLIRDELRTHGLRCMLLFALSEQTVERWEVRGTLPVSIDDMLRSIAARDPSLVAVGHVGLATLHLNGQARRSFYCEIERDGLRGRWMLPMVQEGDPLPPDHPGLEMLLGQLKDPKDRWLGVAPGVEMNFAVLGMEGMASGPVAEG